MDPSRYFELKAEYNTHPSPWDDGLRSCVERGFLFASPSMENLKEWFDPYANSTTPHDQWMRDCDIREFKKNGFKVHVFWARKYKIGVSERQVAFRKEVARLLEVLPLESLFNTVASV